MFVPIMYLPVLKIKAPLKYHLVVCLESIYFCKKKAIINQLLVNFLCNARIFVWVIALPL